MLTVTHLLYPTGHTAPAGDQLVRAELVERSLDLARMLSTLMPDDREVGGLLALLLLTDARRATRTSDGRLLLLEDKTAPAGTARPSAKAASWSTRRSGGAGRAASPSKRRSPPCTPRPPSYADTDWPEVLGLYDLLLAVWPSPVVALNRAVAVAMVHGPAAGLVALEEVAHDPHLATYPYLVATRADLLRRLGQTHAPPRPTEPRSPWPPTPPRKISSPGDSPRSPLPEGPWHRQIRNLGCPIPEM